MRLVTTEEMRALEQRAYAAGVSEAELMERAGTAVACAAAEWLANVPGQDVLVLVGKGNNGGDALIAARTLHAQYGVQPWLYLSADRGDDPLLHWAAAGAVPVIVHDATSGATLHQWLRQADVVIEGLLGIGARLPVTGAIGEILAACREVVPEGQRRIAIDVPAGVQADTGQADAHAFRAHLTLATGPAKPGHFIHPGAELAGRVRALDIGLGDPDTPGKPAAIAGTWRTEPRDAARLLPARPDDSHKGTFGKVLVAGGSSRYVGAPYLAAAAAVRAGAGLVTLAIPGAAQRAIAGRSVETTYLPLPDDPAAPGSLTPAHLETLAEAASGYDAVVIGPGLGAAAETHLLVRRLLALLAADVEVPVLIDADGLNALATGDDWPRPKTARWVLTPHPGEMSRLTGVAIHEIQADRLGTARQWSGRWQQVLVLKGAPSIVATPDGSAHINAYANAALASAGSGDVLSGVCAGLMAQGCRPAEATILGCALHGLAAELWRADHGAAGLAAGHLLDYLPAAQHYLRRLV